MLVIHGAEDGVVPMAQGRRLYEAAREPKRWLAVPNADHGDVSTMGGELYLNTLEEFLASLKRHPC